MCYLFDKAEKFLSSSNYFQILKIKQKTHQTLYVTNKYQNVLGEAPWKIEEIGEK